SGNHAQALALAGKLLDVPVTVIMPSDAPRVKADATRDYGAEIIEYSRDEITREELAAAVAEERSLPIVPPYDHPDIVAGQGTVGLELISSLPDLDALLVCCGGGGLLSGCAIAVKSTNPNTQVIGVEPAAADDATRSFYSGELVTIRDPETIADGARTPSLGSVTFPLVLRYVDDMVTVSEEEIVDAMRFLWERMKIVVEPTGALAAAAILSGKFDVAGKQVAAVISGGNVDLKRALSLLSRGEKQS
ncbi:MAG: pyridoxal-phosphate dependent enzyme, partial [Rhodothermia bacterium]|nr:pyridoxal-phosphate dependent enzyme [Rhodothermia bacterium]